MEDNQIKGVLSILGDVTEQVIDTGQNSTTLIKGSKLSVVFAFKGSLIIVEVYLNVTADLDIPVFATCRAALTVNEVIEKSKDEIIASLNHAAATIIHAAKITLEPIHLAELNGRFAFSQSSHRLNLEKSKTLLEVLREMRACTVYGSEEASAYNDVISYVNKELQLYRYKEKFNRRLASFISTMLNVPSEEVLTILTGIENGKSKGIAAYVAAS